MREEDLARLSSEADKAAEAAENAERRAIKARVKAEDALKALEDANISTDAT